MNAAPSAPQPPAKSLLSECRDMARTRLADVVAAALAKIDEDLFQLADKSIKRDEQQVYLDAMTRVRQHRAEIQRKFEECFKTIYDQRIDAGKPPPKHAKPDPLADFGGIELSLVSDSIIESGIAIDRLAKNVMSSLDNDELLGIRARFGALLNRDTLEDGDNPLSPEAIFEALKLACNHIPAEDAVKQALLSAFQPYLSRSITQIYHAINQSLVAHQIMPRIRHTVKTSDPMGTSQRMMGMSASQRLSALSQSGRLATMGPGGDERSGWFGGSTGSGVGLESAAIAGMLAGLSQGHTSARVDGLRMLADPERFPEGQGTVPASQLLLETLARLQTDANLGTTGGLLAPGFLRELDRDLVAHGTPLDQLTIELVTVVFDYLHGNAKVASPIKGLIARLQIVAVKAALLDRSFFARRQHPMRKLLDRMAEAGSDPVVNLAEGGAFLDGVTHIVDDLSVQFKDDVAVFESALEELDALIHRETLARDAAALADATALAAQEALAAADEAARADLGSRLTASTPGFIREFLAGAWVRVIVDAQVNSLVGDDSVGARLGLAADLIWSVEPKARADIQILAAILPKLVRGLVRGVMSLDTPDAERQAFFNQLMKAHTTAIAAAKMATEDVASLPVPSQSPDAPVELKAVPIVPAGDVHQRTALELVKGEMVEFSDLVAGDRYRLTWVSPKRGFYLFTNGGGMRQLAENVLSGLFRQGMAVVVEAQASLIDSALDALSVEAPTLQRAA